MSVRRLDVHGICHVHKAVLTIVLHGMSVRRSDIFCKRYIHNGVLTIVEHVMSVRWLLFVTSIVSLFNRLTRFEHQ